MLVLHQRYDTHKHFVSLCLSAAQAPDIHEIEVNISLQVLSSMLVRVLTLLTGQTPTIDTLPSAPELPPQQTQSVR